jgi:hypothetical protein
MSLKRPPDASQQANANDPRNPFFKTSFPDVKEQARLPCKRGAVAGHTYTLFQETEVAETPDPSAGEMGASQTETVGAQTWRDSSAAADGNAWTEAFRAGCEDPPRRSRTAPTWTAIRPYGFLLQGFGYLLAPSQKSPVREGSRTASLPEITGNSAPKTPTLRATWRSSG